MKKLTIIILTGAAVIAIGTGFAFARHRRLHQYDDYLNQAEDAVQKCVEELNQGSKKYPIEASLFTYMDGRGKKAAQEPEELLQAYSYNRLLTNIGAIDSYQKQVEDTLWHLRGNQYSDPQKIIQEREGEVYYKIKTGIGDKCVDLWVKLNQASNGKWYLSSFLDRPPYDWDGNPPLTEKNREWGQKFVENASDEQIYQMFSWASATQLNGREWTRGFLCPEELGWEEFLNFYFITLDDEERAASYNEKKGRYLIKKEEIGKRIWQYFGTDEHEKNAASSYGFPHGSNVLAEYIPDGGEAGVCQFPQEMADGVKAYDKKKMKLNNKTVLSNGSVLLEVDYVDEDQEEPIINRQVLKVRAMEDGYRFLTYQVIPPGYESEGNRMMEEVLWRKWDWSGVIRFTYQDGTEEKRNYKLAALQTVRDFLKTFAVGKEIPVTELSEDAVTTDTISLQAESGDQKRVLELYNIVDHENYYLLLHSYDVSLNTGWGGGSVSMSVNNIPVSQTYAGERYVLCINEDYEAFREAVLQAINE